MTTQQHKLFRILSGLHAGGSLQLGVGEHKIGAEHDNDIVITDWAGPALVVKLRADEAACISVDGLPELRPVRFGDVIVCIGPDKNNWPTDLELLAQLFEPSTPPAVAATVTKRPRRSTAYALCGGAAAFLTFCLVAVIVQARPQPSLRAANGVAAASLRAKQALDRAGVRGLRINSDASAISIDGMVETREQGQLALSAIRELSLSVDVRPRFAVAEEVIESIRSSIGLPQAQIMHLGDGVFSLQVESADPDGTRAAVGRVAADLAPSVQRIESVVTQSKAAQRSVSVTSSFSDGDVSIIQTKDGSKYFGLSPVDVSAPPQLETSVPSKN
jgi:type III secretion protein D